MPEERNGVMVATAAYPASLLCEPGLRIQEYRERDEQEESEALHGGVPRRRRGPSLPFLKWLDSSCCPSPSMGYG